MGTFVRALDALLEAYGNLDLFRLVTYDAGACFKANAEHIRSRGLHYLLGLKGSQPQLLFWARLSFKDRPLDSPDACTVLASAVAAHALVGLEFLYAKGSAQIPAQGVGVADLVLGAVAGLAVFAVHRHGEHEAARGRPDRSHQRTATTPQSWLTERIRQDIGSTFQRPAVCPYVGRAAAKLEEDPRCHTLSGLSDATVSRLRAARKRKLRRHHRHHSRIHNCGGITVTIHGFTIAAAPPSPFTDSLLRGIIATVDGFTSPGTAPGEPASPYLNLDGRSLLVESAQSMANRLEAVCWDESANDLIEPLRGLSYVKATRKEENGDGEKETYLTSSITDSHRLNSPYILETKDKTFFDALQGELGALEKGPIDRRLLAQKLLKYDASSLVHGVFLAKEQLAGGRQRVTRALTAFIEADGVKVAPSGGSKQDHVDPTGKAFGQGGAEKGFGHVPFPRDEYTAEKITLYASVDLAQIRGYGLGPDATEMLVLLALFKLRAFVDGPMRLRTACSFEVKDVGAMASKNVNDFKLPEQKDILGEKDKWSGELPTLIRKLAVTEDDKPEKVEKMRVTPVVFQA